MKLKKILSDNSVVLAIFIAVFMIAGAQHYLSHIPARVDAAAAEGDNGCFTQGSYGLGGCLPATNGYTLTQIDNGGDFYSCTYCPPNDDNGGGGVPPGGCYFPTTQTLNCSDTYGSGYTGTYTQTKNENNGCNWETTSYNCVPPQDCAPSHQSISCGAGYQPGSYTQTTNYNNPPECDNVASVTDDKSSACTPIPAPTCDLKVNGLDGPYQLDGVNPYTFTWTSNGYQFELTSPQNGPLSDQDNGTQVYPGDAWYPAPGTSLNLSMQCDGNNGSASDTVVLSTRALSAGRIAFNSNEATNVTISSNSESQSAVGLSGSVGVHPPASGASYYISVSDKPGETYTITNTKGQIPGSSMTMYPGDDKEFDITYTASSCTAPTTQTQQVACDAPYNTGSVTQVRSKDPAQSCNWGAWTYQSDDCSISNSAGIVVSSNSTASWTITPGSLSGSGSASRSVDPGNGTTYTITPAHVDGYDWSVAWSKGSGTNSGTSMTLFNGDNGLFSINYFLLNGGDFGYRLSTSGTVTINRSSPPTNGVWQSQGTVTASLDGGTPGTVSLGFSGLPAGVSVSSSPTSGCTPTCSWSVIYSATAQVSAGDYPITITGTPGNVPASPQATLHITGSPVSVTCVPSPAVVKVGDPVTWTANVNGGSGSYTYAWSGTSIPVPAPTGNPYVVNYSTVGIKNTTVTVTDAVSHVSASCDNSTVQVNLNPKLEEF